MDASVTEKPTRLTIFNQLLDPEVAEGHVVPSVDDLKDEALSIVTAAADTTGNAMTIAAYNVISNKTIYRRLETELREAFPDSSATLEFLALEKLPYLVCPLSEIGLENLNLTNFYRLASSKNLLGRLYTPADLHSG
jgi:Cytochrome P450